MVLPEEWLYETSLFSGEGSSQEGVMTGMTREKEAETVTLEPNRKEGEREEVMKADTETKLRGVLEEGGGKTKKKKTWGPVVVERRSQRNLGDSKTVMEKAQEAKRKWNEEAPKEYLMKEYGTTVDEGDGSGKELVNSLPRQQETRSDLLDYKDTSLGKKSRSNHELMDEEEPMCMKGWIDQLYEMELLLRQGGAVEA